MCRVEERTAPPAPPPLVRKIGAADGPLEPDVEPSYDTLPIKPTRSVAVVARRVGKIAPVASRSTSEADGVVSRK